MSINFFHLFCNLGIYTFADEFLSLNLVIDFFFFDEFGHRFDLLFSLIVYNMLLLLQFVVNFANGTCKFVLVLLLF